MAALVLFTASSSEPVSLAEAKLHLRIDGTDEDALITSLIIAAREQVEAIIKSAVITQTWDLYLDNFYSCIRMPITPLQSVTSIKYIDTDGVEQTVSSAVYTVDNKTEPGRIYPAYNQEWPTPRSIPLAVTIRFVAGHGDDSTEIPSSIIAAMKLLIGHWYENREESSPINLKQIPVGVRALLGPYIVDIM